MFSSLVASRTIKLLIMSAISSLPFALMQLMKINSRIVLLISFVLFFLLAIWDAYTFPFDFWQEVNSFEGVVLPYLCVFCVAFVCFLNLKSFIFNFIFLPFRFAECFGDEIKTATSVIVVFLFVLAVSWIVSLFSYRTAQREFYEYVYPDEEDTLQVREDNFTTKN